MDASEAALSFAPTPLQFPSSPSAAALAAAAAAAVRLPSAPAVHAELSKESPPRRLPAALPKAPDSAATSWVQAELSNDAPPTRLPEALPKTPDNLARTRSKHDEQRIPKRHAVVAATSDGEDPSPQVIAGERRAPQRDVQIAASQRAAQIVARDARMQSYLDSAVQGQLHFLEDSVGRELESIKVRSDRLRETAMTRMSETSPSKLQRRSDERDNVWSDSTTGSGAVCASPFAGDDDADCGSTEQLAVPAPSTGTRILSSLRGACNMSRNVELLDLYERNVLQAGDKLEEVTQDVKEMRAHLAGQEERLEALCALFNEREDHFQWLRNGLTTPVLLSPGPVAEPCLKSSHNDARSCAAESAVAAVIQDLEHLEQRETERWAVVKKLCQRLEVPRGELYSIDSMDSLAYSKLASEPTTDCEARLVLLEEELQNNRVELEALVNELVGQFHEVVPKVVDQEQRIRQLEASSKLQKQSSPLARAQWRRSGTGTSPQRQTEAECTVTASDEGLSDEGSSSSSAELISPSRRSRPRTRTGFGNSQAGGCVRRALTGGLRC